MNATVPTDCVWPVVHYPLQYSLYIFASVGNGTFWSGIITVDYMMITHEKHFYLNLFKKSSFLN